MSRNISLAVSLALSATLIACNETTEPLTPSHTLEAVTPVELSATVATEVTPGPTVRVKDDRGNPAPGVQVVFFVDNGSRVSAITDAAGTATMGSWKLGPAVGTYSVRAWTAHSAMPVDFRIVAKPDVPASIKRLDADLLTGIVGFAGDAFFFDVRVADRLGNATPDVPVSFRVLEGAGSISATRERTDSYGTIRVGWTFGSVGENSIEASVAGLEPVTLIARVEEPADASVGSFELDNIQEGNVKLQPFTSWIALGANGQFTVYVNGVVGHGEYTLNSTTIDFKYSDQFIGALITATGYYPAYSSSASERGYLDGNTLVLYRCYADECFDTIWNYRRSAKP